ncbi:hypothetical protein BKA62DRAFT_684756 [Auriculariales sp. MPI-PUGE-AT-0066]|nr:hypothetical protein BKA62DRAFT_684756 [Auriculariales sp. MPI-PUGE-AT-0066]
MSAEDLLVVVFYPFGLLRSMEEAADKQRVCKWLDYLFRPTRWWGKRSAILAIHYKHPSYDDRIIVALDREVVDRAHYARYLGEHELQNFAAKEAMGFIDHRNPKIFEFDEAVFKGKIESVSNGFQYRHTFYPPPEFNAWNRTMSGCVDIEIYPPARWCKIPQMPHRLEKNIQQPPQPNQPQGIHNTHRNAGAQIPEFNSALNQVVNTLSSNAQQMAVDKKPNVKLEPVADHIHSAPIKSDPYEEEVTGMSVLRAEDVKMKSEQERRIKSEDRDIKWSVKREAKEEKEVFKPEGLPSSSFVDSDNIRSNFYPGTSRNGNHRRSPERTAARSDTHQNWQSEDWDYQQRRQQRHLDHKWRNMRGSPYHRAKASRELPTRPQPTPPAPTQTSAARIALKDGIRARMLKEA